MPNYCHLCGSPYVRDKSNPWECAGCGNIHYENPCPTSDIILFDKRGQALLAERGEDPAKGKYDSIGGFVEIDETFEEAVKREILEELDLDSGDYTTPVYVRSLTAS